MKAALDHHRQVALAEVLDMLGVKPGRLNREIEGALLAVFYSFPADRRDDPDAIEVVLNLMLRMVTGLDRAATRATVSQSEELRQLLCTVTNKIGDLLGDRRLQKLPQSAAE